MATSITNTSITTDQLNVDSNTLYVDATNNRVGIGTAAPNEALTIEAPLSGNTGLAINYSGDNKAGITVNPITGQIQVGVHPDLTSAGAYYLSFNTASSNTVYERMKIDSSGRVTKPYQPVFFAYNLNFPDSNSAGTASGGTDIVNIGSHYSTGTGRFTAPIAGTYVFYMMTQAYDSGNTSGQYQTAVFRKNGSNVGAEAYHGWQPNDGNNHVQVQNTVIITLAANDYIMAYVQYGARDIQNYFGGYLLG
jgi:hypothetical protein